MKKTLTALGILSSAQLFAADYSVTDYASCSATAQMVSISERLCLEDSTCTTRNDSQRKMKVMFKLEDAVEADAKNRGISIEGIKQETDQLYNQLLKSAKTSDPYAWTNLINKTIDKCSMDLHVPLF